MQRGAIEDAIREAAGPALGVALGLGYLHLALWKQDWIQRRWARPVAYVLGVGALELGFAGWAARTGRWDAWVAHQTVTAAGGAVVLALWAGRAARELSTAQDAK